MTSGLAADEQPARFHPDNDSLSKLYCRLIPICYYFARSSFCWMLLFALTRRLHRSLRIPYETMQLDDMRSLQKRSFVFSTAPSRIKYRTECTPKRSHHVKPLCTGLAQSPRHLPAAQAQAIVLEYRISIPSTQVV